MPSFRKRCWCQFNGVRHGRTQHQHLFRKDRIRCEMFHGIEHGEGARGTVRKMRVLHESDQKIDGVIFDGLPGLVPEHRKENPQQNQRVQKAPEESENRALILELELSQRELVQGVEVFFSIHKNARPSMSFPPESEAKLR